jgi:adenosylcobyric acid synthase
VACSQGPLGGISGAALAGYEIHMGRTECPGEPLFALAGGRLDGAVSSTGRVLGTYLHGLFHNPLLTDALVAWLCRQKGVSLPSPRGETDPYDRLADVLRGSLDVPKLRRLAG